MQRGTSADATLASDITDRIAELIEQAEAKGQPLEVDPHRGRIFELFVTAEAAGCVMPDSDCDLTADGVCKELARRWNLADATKMSIESRTRLSPENLAKMRLLWSLMRMWMEWTYAWNRWDEFHEKTTGHSPTQPH